MAGKLTNWAGSVTFQAEALRRPESVDELRSLVAGSRKVRALGTGHCFNDIADTPHTFVSVAGLPDIFQIDTAAGTVTVGAALRYAEVGRRLHEQGYALANLASLPHITVAGSVATGTHGSGDANGNLSSAVAGITMVTAGGDLVRLRRGDDGFDGAVVALGALGVVTEVTLDVVPTYDLRQNVYQGLPFEVVGEHLDAVFSAAYSVSLFTSWNGPDVDQVWIKRRTDDTATTPVAEDWFSATAAEWPLHPVPGIDPAPCTPQLGVPGPWYERLPHFRPEFTPSSGVELQTEFLVPRRHAVEALRAVDEVRDRVAAVLQISEIRTMAGDGLWLSPAYGRDTVAIHFTWVKDMAGVLPVIELLEERLAPYDPRPHWGKLFTTATPSSYPRLEDFRALMRHYDPDGKFTNDYVERHVLDARV
jgi:xylitol oxidase